MRKPLFLLALALAACEERPADAPPVTPVQGPPPVPALQGADPNQNARAAPADALIAFTRGPELWTMMADGSGARLVVRMEGEVAQPAWSPNRGWIAFSSTSGAQCNLYRRNLFLVRPDGTELRQVTPLPRSSEDLETAPKGQVRGRAVAIVDGGRIGAKDFDVAVFGRRTITKTREGGLFEAYVPAGASWIKVSGTLNGVRYSGAVMQEIREGHTSQLPELPLTPEGADDEASAPLWASDGRSLYFLLRSRRACSLNRIALDGSGREPVFTDARSAADAVAVSGETAMIRLRDGRLLKISLETRQPVDQWIAGIAPAGAVAASPDGGTTAFTRTDEQLRTILVVRRGDERTVGTPLPGLVSALDFSPDGGSLVYDLRGERGSNLFIVDLATGASRALTNDGISSSPAWYGR